jgi:hypothetical protein
VTATEPRYEIVSGGFRTGEYMPKEEAERYVERVNRDLERRGSTLRLSTREEKKS